MIREVLLDAVNAGAAELSRYFNTAFKVSNKEGLNNLVTEADLAAEAAIFSVIRNTFPDHFLLSEEAGEVPTNNEYKWIIDPIDGTVNFAHGIPICCVSIGVEKAGEMIFGAVYNPFMNELFFAEKGAGATLNSKAISVSQQRELKNSCLVTGFPYSYNSDSHGLLETFERFISKGIPVRRLGSAAIDLCWVAAGRFDGFYEYKLNAWDSAAGALIVEEAGGKVTDFTGGFYSPYQPRIAATNGLIHSDLLEVIGGGDVKMN